MQPGWPTEADGRPLIADRSGAAPRDEPDPPAAALGIESATSFQLPESLASQLRRMAVSIDSNIAEGYDQKKNNAVADLRPPTADRSSEGTDCKLGYAPNWGPSKVSSLREVLRRLRESL